VALHQLLLPRRLPLSTAASDTIAPRFTQGSLEEELPDVGQLALACSKERSSSLRLAEVVRRLSLDYSFMRSMLPAQTAISLRVRDTSRDCSVGWNELYLECISSRRPVSSYKDDADWAIVRISSLFSQRTRPRHNRVSAGTRPRHRLSSRRVTGVAGSVDFPPGPSGSLCCIPFCARLKCHFLSTSPTSRPSPVLLCVVVWGMPGSNGDLKSAAKGSSVGLESTPELQPVSPGTHHANPTAAASAAKPASQTGSVEPVAGPRSTLLRLLEISSEA